MQKARRHPLKGSDRLQAHGFRVYFTPLFEVLFTFPSRYWFTIGLRRVFSLGGWSRRFHARFLVSRATQDTGRLRQGFVYGIITLCDPTFQMVPLLCQLAMSRSYNPGPAETGPVWAVPVSLAATSGITIVFFSYGYLDVSVPHVRLPLYMEWYNLLVPGCPIRISADRFVFANPRGFSQLITSFVAFQSPGIPHVPLFTFISPSGVHLPRENAAGYDKYTLASLISWITLSPSGAYLRTPWR